MATEKRLIDANALKSEMYIISRLSGSENICIECIVDAICDAPTVDAVEVVHGRWEFSHTTTVEKYDVVKCSNCGHEAFAIAIYVKEGHYCPNCGAKMDGDGNG